MGVSQSPVVVCWSCNMFGCVIAGNIMVKVSVRVRMNTKKPTTCRLPDCTCQQADSCVCRSETERDSCLSATIHIVYRC